MKWWLINFWTDEKSNTKFEWNFRETNLSCAEDSLDTSSFSLNRCSLYLNLSSKPPFLEIWKIWECQELFLFFNMTFLSDDWLLACTLDFFGFPNSECSLDFRFWLLPFWTLLLLGFRVYLIATLSSVVSYNKNNNIINYNEKSIVGSMF